MFVVLIIIIVTLVLCIYGETRGLTNGRNFLLKQHYSNSLNTRGGTAHPKPSVKLPQHQRRYSPSQTLSQTPPKHKPSVKLPQTPEEVQPITNPQGWREHNRAGEEERKGNIKIISRTKVAILPVLRNGFDMEWQRAR